MDGCLIVQPSILLRKLEYGRSSKSHKIKITDSKSTCHVSNYKVDFRYQRTNNMDAIRRLLGQSSVTATSAYLGVSDNSALELSRKINV